MTTPIAPGVGVNLLGQHSADRNQDAIAYVGDLDPKVSQDKKSLDVGADIFIGNLDPDVDEKLLHDTFNAFGVIVTNPKIMRDPETGNSRGFISYDSFEASDAAIGAMNGQYLCNLQITVSYAYKKDIKGERHDTPVEGISAEEDFVVREINVYFNPSPIDEGTKLFVLQYPLRPAWRPYELDKECKIRVKPASTDVEIELPVDSKHFDPEAPSAQRFDKLTVSSEWRPLQRTAYTIGVLTGSELHLNPVFAIRQLRPSMEYLNPSASKMKSVSEVATKATSSTAESSRNPNKVMDQKDNETCIPLEFHGSSSHLSARYRAKMFAAMKSPLTFPMKPLYYLDSLCPQAAIDKTKPAAQSKRSPGVEFTRTLVVTCQYGKYVLTLVVSEF